MVALVVGAAMWVMAQRLPTTIIHYWPNRSLAAVFIALGVLSGLAGVLSFRRANTTVDPTQPEASTTVVTSGIYRFSRNPMYVGLLLVLLGWACYLANPWCWLILPAFVLYMNHFQIIPEEQALAAKFGEAYHTYRQRVRRWL